MNFPKYVYAIALGMLLSACQTSPEPVVQEGLKAQASEAETVKTAQQQWDETKPALLQAFRTDARLRVIEQADGSLYIQIRSGSSFNVGGAKPSGDLAAVLDHIAKVVEGQDFLRLVISGHSDNLGNERHNVDLSEQRARGVFDYLQGKGVQQPMRYEGLGSQKPIASNDTSEGRAVNRRVDITLLP